MKKRILSFLLMAAMVIAFIPLSASGEVATAEANTEWLGDDAEYEAATVYEITGVADFLAFTDAIANGKTFAGKVVKFTADVDLGARNVDPSKPGGQTGDGVNEGADFAFKAANSKKIFSGVIDGQGHTLQGVNISFGSGDYVGIFGGYLVPSASVIVPYGCNAGVCNLSVTNSFVRGKNWIGGLFGLIYAGSTTGTIDATVKFENLYLDIDLYSNNVTALTGTISGASLGNIKTKVNNCVCAGNITGMTTGSVVDVGGFFGQVGRSKWSVGDVTIQNSAFLGTITVASTTVQKTGGFVGEVGLSGSNLHIEDCISCGTMTLGQKTNCGTVCGVAISGTELNIVNTLDGTVPTPADMTTAQGNGVASNGTVRVDLSPANLQSTLNENGFADKFTMDETGKVLPLGLLGMKKDAINAAHTAATASADYAAKIIGYQTTSPADGKFDLQIRGGVKEAGLAEYSAIGLELVVINEEGSVLTNVANGGSVPEMTKVYSSILVGGEETSAASLNTGYLFGATVQNIPQNVGNVTILARVFFVKDGVKNHSDIAVITVDTGAIA